VDSHTHLVWAGSREDELRRRLAGARYGEIAAEGGGIVATMRATREASLEDLCELAAGRLATMLLWGTTTAEAKSGYGLDVPTELRQLQAVRALARRQPIELVPTFLGAHSVPPEHRGDREGFVRLLLDEALPAVVAEGLAEFCDVFCEPGAFTVEESRRILMRAAELGLGVKIHADELAASGGAELAAELGAVSAEHLMKASAAGRRALARAGVLAVLLPATSLFLMEEPADGPAFRDAGCAIALATDLNPGSSPTESLPLVAVLACLRNRLTPEEAVTGVTLNAAAAVRRADRLGSLEEGKQADLVVLRDPTYLHLVYHFGVNPVRHVVKAGRVVVLDSRPT
jgi:imidazolonepropionase